MRDNFQRALTFTLKWEGGYSKDPNDPGGETNYGISKRAYPYLDIANLTLEQATDIYLRDYWIKARCDALPWPLDMVVFDTAVNVGVGRAVGMLDTLDWNGYLWRRVEWYAKVSMHPDRYLRGWINRVVSLHKEVLA